MASWAPEIKSAPNQFASTVVAAGVLHEKVNAVDDPVTQLVLKGSCADVSKIVYLLRLNGDKPRAAELEGLDGIQRASVAHTLHGDISDLAWTQATARKKKAGLGLRDVTELALPAFIASHVASRCGV